MRKPDVDEHELTRCLRDVFGSRELRFERTPDGTSTQVYRLGLGGRHYYVRVAETAEDCFAPEAELHIRLVRAGVRAPEVVAVVPHDAGLDRSVMVTTEIPGGPIGADTPEPVIVWGYRAAGRDLAVINDFTVDGFDFVRRDHGTAGWPLRGQSASYADYVNPPQAGELTAIGYDHRRIRALERLLAEVIDRDPTTGVGTLVHGDFDATHVFTDGGRYSGLIDFGEIRGAHGDFDLATMLLNVESAYTRSAFAHLLKGYAEVKELPEDHDRALYLACVLSATHRLCTWVRRGVGGWFFDWIAARLDELLTAGRVRWM